MTLLWEIRLRLIAPIQEGKLLHITENAHSGTLPARLFCHLAYQQFLSSSWSCLFLTSPGFFFFLSCLKPSEQAVHWVVQVVTPQSSKLCTQLKPNHKSCRHRHQKLRFPADTSHCKPVAVDVAIGISLGSICLLSPKGCTSGCCKHQQAPWWAPRCWLLSAKIAFIWWPFLCKSTHGFTQIH